MGGAGGQWAGLIGLLLLTRDFYGLVKTLDFVLSITHFSLIKPTCGDDSLTDALTLGVT